MKDTDLAWAAGIIDGEGCIYIQRLEIDKKSGRLSPSFRIGMRVVMGHEAAIRRLHQMFKVGSVHKLTQRGWNDAWAYHCQSQKAETVIRLVRPYLMVKAEEADVALEFRTLPLWRPGGNGGCFSPTPLEIVTKKNALYERMRDLKPSSRFRRSKEVK